MPAFASLALPVLRRIDPERAHRIGLLALRAGLGGRDSAAEDPILATRAFGRAFRNPIGLAAGFDKDAAALPALLRLGFGFVEAGTVTLQPQPGNPRPRQFRLTEDRAVINRMGFNGGGLARFQARLAALGPHAAPVGANLGLNKEGAQPERDYPALAAALAPHADYLAINVSSPNTPGLRELQAGARLGAILSAIAAALPHPCPVLVKIAPDLTPAQLEEIVGAAIEGGAAGLIVSNTTLARPALRSRHATQAGGLSGVPLFGPSTALLARAHLLAGNRLTLIGAGGVASGRDAWAKIRAGASLVQLYTAFAYAGPALLPRLKAELAAIMRAEGAPSIAAAIGRDAARLAESPCSA